MRIFATEIQAISPIDGELKRYGGPRINAPSFALAQEYCELNGLGYCKVVAELIAEIPCKPGTYDPDFDNTINYSTSDN